ncbi:hypothetical protein LJ737_20870 [Hymenobacter sp. 15J16-1T3B]|uniref:hypothetical protein n=1 Tax=Hymenobacter sp. 15J16-1T3B TaxID=2886941 RepID=UPI001D1047FA|nr:hypothetical protein [Hymenobacter sp. 15J16-1T3B]MCC3159707.1 hypothetical protein [Hymenobacter sp. 15J16-1T3B]
MCWPCHYCFEHDKRRFAALSPDVWARKLAAIKALSPEQYQLLHIKYPDLVPEA